MTQYEKDMVNEGAAFCRAVANCGIMSSVAMAQYARLRNVWEGKPAGGKWEKWAEDMEQRKKELHKCEPAD